MAVYFQEKMLAHQFGFTTSPVTFYQRPASKTTLVKNIDIVNTNTAATTFSIYFNNSAATFGTTHLLLPLQVINPNQTLTFTEFRPLGNTQAAFGWLPGTTGLIAYLWGAEVNE